LDWNPQEARGRRRTKQIWKMSVWEEAECEAKHGVSLRCWRTIGTDGDASQISCVPNGAKEYTAATATATTTTTAAAATTTSTAATTAATTTTTTTTTNVLTSD
jgi:hypothetical protein